MEELALPRIRDNSSAVAGVSRGVSEHLGVNTSLEIPLPYIFCFPLMILSMILMLFI